MEFANGEPRMHPAPHEQDSASNPASTSLPSPNNNIVAGDRLPQAPQQLDHAGIATNNSSVGASSSSLTRSASSGATPPYWRHQRDVSRASCASSLDANLITLEDHSDAPASDTSGGLWAKSVSIDDHVVVKGQTGIGAYVVWLCNIQLLEGGSMTVRMRYSEFVELRTKLALGYPHAKKAMPPLPPKSALWKFSPKFLETRRVGLAYFLNCILLNPEFAGSPILKDTLFSHLA